MEEFAKKKVNSADNFVRFFRRYAENSKVGMCMKRYSVSSQVLMSSFAIILLASLSFSCKNNVNTMLDDYNGHYEPATNPALVKNPGQAGFKEEDMLSDIYTENSDGSIHIAGPFNCKSYEWKFYKTENNIKRESGPSALDTTLIEITDKLDFFPSSGKDKREFRFYIPKSQLGPNDFLGPGTYILKLTVIGNNNITYTDWCLVIIYEQIYGKENFFKEE